MRARGGGGCASKTAAPEKKPTETENVKRTTVEPEVATLEAVEVETTQPKAPEPWALTIEDYRDPESIYAQLVPRGGLDPGCSVERRPQEGHARTIAGRDVA